jgi:hypothetical protein
MIKKILLLVSILASTTTFAAGVPASFTYQGIVMNSAGTAPLTSVVSLKLSIYDPTGTCLLYQEQQANIDLSQTNGTFAVQVGSSVGAAKRVSGTDQGLAMPSVFANNGQILAASTTGCTTGYTPAANDGRLLRVAVTNGGSTVTISPDLQINSVPNSMVAETLQGYSLAQVRAAPGRTVITATGPGTYNVPAGTSYLEIKMAGGGGGGAGSGSSSGSVAGNGGITTFGSSLLSATGGTAGTWAGAGAAGGTASLGTGPIGIALSGGTGGASSQTNNVSSSLGIGGGSGGNNPLGGAGSGSSGGLPSTAFSGAANTGSGGGGGQAQAGSPATDGGGGGGAGGYIDAIITNPGTSYSYNIGIGGGVDQQEQMEVQAELVEVVFS